MIKLGPVQEIPLGEGRVYAVNDEKVAVFRARNGHIYAVQAQCPHKGGPLADGLLGGTTLICPLHGWKFDLTAGQALSGDCRLKTYPVGISEDEEIFLS